MSSIPAAVERLTDMAEFFEGATDPFIAESVCKEHAADLRWSLAELSRLEEENSKLRAERDEALEQVAAYRAGCVRVFNNLCPKCRGHAQLPEKALDPDWAASLKVGADV